jgi:hypothetical protein
MRFNEDFGTNTNDIDSMLDAVLDFVYTYDYWDNDAIDQETGYFTEDAIEQTRDMLENRDPALADYLESYVNDFVEDGEKFDGKIADIIDYLRGRDSDEDKLHAMAMKNEDVNKVNTSDFDKWCLKNVAPKVKEEVAKIKKQIKAGAIDTEDIDGIVSAIATNVFNLVTDAVAPYVDKKQTNEAYVEYDNTITSEQMDDAIEEGYPVKVVINGEYYDYKSMRKYESVKNKKLKEAYSGVDLNDYKDLIYAVLDAVDTLNIELGSETNKRARQLLSKLEHDEYAQRIDKDTDEWSDDDYENEYEYKVGKREKEIDAMYDDYGHPYNESVEEEIEADDDFTDGEAETDENMNESLAGIKKLPVKTFERNPSEQTQVPQTAELEDEVADESFAHDDSM